MTTCFLTRDGTKDFEEKSNEGVVPILKEFPMYSVGQIITDNDICHMNGKLK